MADLPTKALLVATSVAATLLGWALIAGTERPHPQAAVPPLPTLVPRAGAPIVQIRSVSPRVHARTRSSR